MQRFWTDKLDNILRRHYPMGDLAALAERLGVTVASVKNRAGLLGLHRKVNVKEKWTDRQLDYLRKHYADMRAEDIAEKVRHSVNRVWYMAKRLGLKKSLEFYQECGRRSAETEGAKASRFRKGQAPVNKGKRQEEFMSPDAIERTKATRFKKGHVPHNARPVGYERINEDGYILLKPEEGRKMVLKHRHVWEQHHGAIPKGMLVTFRDGNRLNCDIGNLELRSMAENARLRMERETPEARRSRCNAGVATRNESIRIDRLRMKYGLKPKTKLIKRTDY